MKESDIEVDYINHMGNDLTVVNAARVSFGSESYSLTDKDRRLIDYLAKHNHMSPFEHCQLTVKIKVPLYIRSQIHRHRTFSYNEISRRYTSRDLEFYLPKYFRKQSADNKQASDGKFDDYKSKYLAKLSRQSVEHCLQTYKSLVDDGVAREIARGVLPQNLMTEFYMTGNLRNWAHFLNLRIKGDAQLEVQKVSNKLKYIIEERFGYSARALGIYEDIV